jgi:hypothetical protein
MTVAPITVAAIFYAIFEEVTAFAKTEKLQANLFHGGRQLLR